MGGEGIVNFELKARGAGKGIEGARIVTKGDVEVIDTIRNAGNGGAVGRRDGDCDAGGGADCRGWTASATSASTATRKQETLLDIRSLIFGAETFQIAA